MNTMTVSQLAGAAGVTAATVRYYARLGLIPADRDPHNGYRRFSGVSLQRLKFIKTAQGLGFKLDDIRAIFADAERGDSPCPRVRELVARYIEQSAVHIRQLQALQARLRVALQQWDAMADGAPDGHSVCRLIESLEPD
jgi:DNA-binding transcriptional MerR regulator